MGALLFLFKRGDREGALLGAEGAEAAKPRIDGRGELLRNFISHGFLELNRDQKILYLVSCIMNLFNLKRYFIG